MPTLPLIFAHLVPTLDYVPFREKILRLPKHREKNSPSSFTPFMCTEKGKFKYTE